MPHKDVASAGPAAAVLHEGVLHKKGDKRHNWKERHFVLRGDALTYYGKKGGKAKGALQLDPSSAVKRESMQRSAKHRKPLVRNSRCCFEVIGTDGRTFKTRVLEVYAGNEADAEAWMGALTDAIRALQTAPGGENFLAPGASGASGAPDAWCARGTTTPEGGAGGVEDLRHAMVAAVHGSPGGISITGIPNPPTTERKIIRAATAILASATWKARECRRITSRQSSGGARPRIWGKAPRGGEPKRTAVPVSERSGTHGSLF